MVCAPFIHSQLEFSMTKVIIALITSLFVAFSASAKEPEKKTELKAVAAFDVPQDIKAQYVAKQVHQGKMAFIALDTEAFKLLVGKQNLNEMVFLNTQRLCHSDISGRNWFFYLEYVTILNGVMYSTTVDIRSQIEPPFMSLRKSLTLPEFKTSKDPFCELKDGKILVKGWK